MAERKSPRACDPTLEVNLQDAFNVIKLKEKKLATERGAGASSSQSRAGMGIDPNYKRTSGGDQQIKNNYQYKLDSNYN